MSVILHLLGKKRKRRLPGMIMRSIAEMDTLPEALINPELTTADLALDYIRNVNDFGQAASRNCDSLITDLIPGLKHHSIHCVSAVDSFPVLINMTLEQFGKLLSFLKVALVAAFPKSPLLLEPNQRSQYSSIRMKLFMFLYRCKNGVSFYHMEALFGWCKSMLQSQFDRICTILYRVLYFLHDGILSYLGPQYQQYKATEWRAKHILAKDLQDFLSKIRHQNEAHAKKKKDLPLIEEDKFVGVIGSVDGTYSIRPAVTSAILEAHGEDPSSDRMYSDYIKLHAYKLMVLTSQGGGLHGKLILYIAIGAGSSSESALYTEMLTPVEPLLLDIVALLGDNAFHGARRVIAPYHSRFIESAGLSSHCQAFNKSHSGDRMTSEHGIGMLKRWAVVRGRSDIGLFENDDIYYKCVKVCQALTNYCSIGCQTLTLHRIKE